MAEEFEDRDLSDADFWAVDLSRARFRDVNLTDVSISRARVVNVDIDGLVDRVTINEVDVTDYVNERDRWYPLRAMLRPADPEGMRAAWEALRQTWATTIERARHLTEEQRHESVGGEWSFVDTLRHLVMAMDKWFTVPVLGDAAFDPIGLPNTGSRDFPFPGLDLAAGPTFDEVLAVRARQSARLADFLRDVSAGELTREVEVLENGTTPVNECLFTVFEEEFEHHRYAVRDLAHFD
jgi:uncharacterized protein YjbI with pentapeptide repeats